MQSIAGFIIIVLLNFCISINIYGDEIKEGVLRTPDERFDNLKDYPFKPNYMMIDGLRIHYLDEGPKDADPIFLLHGEPAWSYLFRKMIPVLTSQGHRVIVPDCVGFGKSDKFISKYDYSYKHHVEVMKELVQKLNLQNATFFGQDWGGLVGLRVVAELPDRFDNVVVSNTGMVARSGISAWLYEKWDKPFLVAFGENERITLPMKAVFLERIPNPTVITLGGASHFVQEEVGPELAQIISDFIQGKPVADLPAKN